MKKKETGIGFIVLLQAVFIALKLLKVINWHWVLVCLPFIINIGGFLLLVAIGWATILIIERKGGK